MNCSWYKEQRITVVRIGITIGKDGLKDKGKTQSDDCVIREINLELVKCIFTSLVWNQVSQTRPCMKPGKLLEQPAPQMELNFWLSPSVPCEQELFFAVWAVMRKVASAKSVQFSIVHVRNSSRNSQAKVIITSVVKWREFHRNKKNCDNSDLLRKTHTMF